MSVIHAVVVFSGGDVTWAFVGDVGVELVAEAHLVGHVLPILIALFDAPELWVIDGGLERLVEVGVTRVHDGVGEVGAGAV